MLSDVILRIYKNIGAKSCWLSFRTVATAKSMMQTNIGSISRSMNEGFPYTKTKNGMLNRRCYFFNLKTFSCDLQIHCDLLKSLFSHVAALGIHRIERTGA